jgi:parallel beta-helix repeat protein
MHRSGKINRVVAGKIRRAVIEALEARRLLSTVTVSSNAELQSAITGATAGTEIDIAAGDYNGFQLSASGTAAAPIVINGEAGAVINGTPTDLNGYIDISGCSNVTIEGLSIQATGTAARAGIWGGGYVNNQVTNVMIEDNTVNGTDWWGILFGEMNNSLITDNTVSNVQVQHGIYCGNSCTNITISKNTVFDCHGCGIEVNADGTDGGVGISTGIVIDDNTLHDNALTVGAEINFDGVQNSIIENNLLYGGQRNGIALYQVNGNGPSSGDTIVNNTIDINSEGPAGYAAISLLDNATNTTIYNNILSADESSMSIDPGSQVGLKSDNNLFGASGIDPTGASSANNISLSAWQAMGYDAHSQSAGSAVASLFVNATAGNFALVSGSLAIGGGTATDAPPVDLAGNARPTSGSYDIGALQFQGIPPTPPTPPTPPQSPPPVTATKLVFGQNPTGATEGAAISPSVIVDVEDSSGNIVTTDSSSVTLTLSISSGGLEGTLTADAIHGVATFSDLSVNNAGTFTLRATDGSLTSAVSDSFSISAPVTTVTALKLAFVGQPSAVTVGGIISPDVTVYIEDASGDRVTTDDSDVVLAIVSGPGNLGGTVTVAANNGIATFGDLSLSSSGSYEIKATSGSLATATSNEFSVTSPVVSGGNGGVGSGSGDQLVIVSEQNSAGAFGGVYTDVTVAIENHSGTVMTSDNSMVSANISGGPTGAVLSGTLSVAASHGYATFEHLSLNQAGNYSLSFADGAANASLNALVRNLDIPLKFRWWFGGYALSTSSAPADLESSQPFIPAAAEPATKPRVVAKPAMVAYAAPPTIAETQASSDLNSSNSTDSTLNKKLTTQILQNT